MRIKHGFATLLLIWLAPSLVSAQALYEPPNGQVYFGMMYRSNWGTGDPATGDTRSFKDRMQDTLKYELAGKSPTLFMEPTMWQHDDGSPVRFSEVLSDFASFTAIFPNAVPFVSWDARRGWDFNNTSITTQTINAGTQDAYIHQYARDVSAYGKPVFFRAICAEFNGSWGKYCSPRANPTLSKQDYINALRRVIDIFRAEGAGNAMFVWSPNTYPRPPVDWGFGPDFADYYPGDNYVDWVGMDHYDYGNAQSVDDNPLDVALWLDPIHDFAALHNKPVMISEFGQRHSSDMTPAQEQQWLNNMFDYVAAHPRIKSINYFNYNMNYWADLTGHTFLYNGQVNYVWGAHDSDHRLIAESGSQMRQTFAARISDPRYVSNIYVPPLTGPAVTISLPIVSCSLTMSAATSPDKTSGWTVQYLLNGQNLGTSDSSAPYERTATVNVGTYVLSAVWTKTGRPAINQALGTKNVGVDCTVN